MKSKTKVYRRLLELAEPVTLEAPWTGIGVPAAICRQALQATDLLERLQADFSAEQLVASNVCQTSPAGEEHGLLLHPGLAAQGNPFVALQTDATRGPSDLLTDCGRISGALPATAALRDVTCSGKEDAASLLFITHSINDLLPLVSLGLRATTASGLAEIRGLALREFCAAFDIERRLALQARPQTKTDKPSPALGSRAVPPDLVLVGWQPGCWSPAAPDAMAAVVEHFVALARYQGIALHNTVYWQPAEGDLERLAFVRDHGTDLELRQVFLEEAGSAPAILAYEAASTDESLTDVMALLRKLPSTANNRRAYQQAVKSLEQAIEQEIIIPVQEQLAATSDPVQRIHLHGLITVSRIVFRELNLIEAALVRKGKSIGAPQPLGTQLAELHQVVSLFDRLRSGCRQVR